MVIYLDSGYLDMISTFISRVDGVTTNPSLLKAAVVKDYREYAASVLEKVKGKLVSFEVFSDDMDGMESQAREISSWGENVYVKIPITNTQGEHTYPIIKRLTLDNIKVNVTAIMTLEQIRGVSLSIHPSTDSIISIFCGRIADTGCDPVPFITNAIRVKPRNTKVLWASTREVYNVKQAQSAGADIITMSPDLIQKMNLFGRDLAQYSLETVKQFHEDAKGLIL